MNKRDLRLAIKQKLDERRQLLTDNSHLRSQNHAIGRERDIALMAMKSRVVNFALEDCADAIVNMVLDEAMKASEIVAEEIFGRDGDFRIGISIPSLHIRYDMVRQDMLDPRDTVLPTDKAFMRHININTRTRDVN